MKIFLINTIYKTGSTGKIVYNLHNFLLKEGHCSVVCYGRGKSYKNETGLVKISSTIEMYLHIILARITGIQGIYSHFATRKLLRLLENYEPDIVHLFNLHGYYINEFKLLRYLKEKNIKTIYSMLDEYSYMGKCTNSFGCNKFETKCYNCPQIRVYPKSLLFDSSTRIFEMKKEAYRDFKNILFTGPQWVLNRARKSSLIGNKNFANVDEFTDLEYVFYPKETSELRNRLGISLEKKIVLNVSPFSNPRKGSIYYLKIARLLENEKIVFIHVGNKGKTTNLPGNFLSVNYLVDEWELAEYYSLADIFVCTSLADTMPNVCLEALACGTPLCGFDTDGIPFVTTPEFGKFTPTYDTLSLSLVIKSAPFKTKERSLACRSYAEMRYSKHQFFVKVMNLYTTTY